MPKEAPMREASRMSERTSCRPPLIRAWTAEDDAKLMELLRQGKQPVVIAARMRRSTHAIYTRKAKIASPEPATQDAGSTS
jgi:hypothetical protein